MENKAGSEATVYLYDYIDWLGVTAEAFVKDLNGIDADTIHLRVNSPGGSVFDARAIYTALKQHKAKVVAHIDGIAASAASFIVLAADEVEIVDGGFFMIHNAMNLVDIIGYFNTSDHDQLSADLDKSKQMLAKVDESLVNDYAKKTGLGKDEIRSMMEAETWLDAGEAVEKGFADRVYDGEVVDGRYDLSMFANAPDAPGKKHQNEPTERELEQALRDAGLSRAKAKAIIACGIKATAEDQRDADTQQPQRDAGEGSRGYRNDMILAKAENY